MKTVLIGATGHSGTRILKELTDRGHEVKALVRDPGKLGATAQGVTAEIVDLADEGKLTEQISGADVVISAYAPPPTDTDQLIGVTETIAKAAEKAGVRLIVVGGAGSLFVSPGVTLLGSGYLPEAYKPIAISHNTLLTWLQNASPKLDWTYFSPAGFFEAGQRTGKFRLGKDDLISNETGESRISFEDYAIALVDEVETPKHRRARFTIGY